MAQNAALLDISIPPYFLCPISLQLMRDPVTLSSGQTYDRVSIQEWLDTGHGNCPITRQPLQQDEELIPNHILSRMIREWCVANRSFEIERVAGPCQTASFQEAGQLVDDIRLGNVEMCTLKKLNGLARKHEMTRKHLLESGVLSALGSSLAKVLNYWMLNSLPAYDSLSPKRLEVAQEILSILVFLCEADNSCDFWRPNVGELSSIAWFLVYGSWDARLNAAAVLSGLNITRSTKRALGRLGLIESVLQLVKDSKYLRASHDAGFRLLLDLCSCSGNRARAAEAGVVDAIVQLLPGADKKTTEVALSVVAALCNCAEGRAAFSTHALSIQVTVKLLNRVSQRATEAALRALLAVFTSPAWSNTTKRVAVEAGVVVRLVMATQQENANSCKRLAERTLRALKEVTNSNH